MSSEEGKEQVKKEGVGYFWYDGNLCKKIVAFNLICHTLHELDDSEKEGVLKAVKELMLIDLE